MAICVLGAIPAATGICCHSKTARAPRNAAKADCNLLVFLLIMSVSPGRAVITAPYPQTPRTPCLRRSCIGLWRSFRFPPTATTTASSKYVAVNKSFLTLQLAKPPAPPLSLKSGHNIIFFTLLWVCACGKFAGVFHPLAVLTQFHAHDCPSISSAFRLSLLAIYNSFSSFGIAFQTAPNSSNVCAFAICSE